MRYLHDFWGVTGGGVEPSSDIMFSEAALGERQLAEYCMHT